MQILDIIIRDDHRFCRDMATATATGVAPIPLSVFNATAPDDPVIRLCFAKPDAVIDEAGARLAACRRSLVD